MESKKFDSITEIPDDYTGVAICNHSVIWMVKGEAHREDGPASITGDDADGVKIWYYKDEYHRVDGPAVVFSTGTVEWWLHNQQFSSAQEWFEHLDSQDQIKAIWNIHEWSNVKSE